MQKCECYHEVERGIHNPYLNQRLVIKEGQCWGTRERDICHCKGDKCKCGIYSYVKKKALKEEQSKQNIKQKDKNLNHLKESLEFYLDTQEINEINGLAIEALEKQIPKKPVTEKDKVIFDIVCGRCPECDSAVYSTTNLYCHKCGQALDWSDTECKIKK